MPIVGTAGHVDHGKSSLVRALTGIDPDRWVEEKERGLTIDLGFAWTDIAGHDVGFVDVPGHEKFIKNMLAGVGAIDCALFVVAADSGWMPQSEEHATVLDLLDVRRGLIALTRVDLVDDDTRELATLEVLEEVAGTTLEGWPIVAVSSVTGTGLETIRSEIAAILDAAESTPDAPFRMWVDRAFRPAGAGLVVTGTVLEGRVHVGDDVAVLPSGAPAKVRGLQHHGRTVEGSSAGSRTAVNLTGAPDDTDRGDLLAGRSTTAVTARFAVKLATARGFDTIPDRGAFRLHLGTASAPVTLRRIQGTDAFVVVSDHPLPMVVGDKVIVRDTGRRSIVGGGPVIDPAPPRRPDATYATILGEALAAGRVAVADALVVVHGSLTVEGLAMATGGQPPTQAIRAADRWMSPARVDHLSGRARSLVSAYHADHPMRIGMPKGELASRLATTTIVIDLVVERADGLAERDGAICEPSFSHTISVETETAWDGIRQSMERSFDVPRVSSLGLDDEVIHFLLRRGDLVRVGDDLAFTREQHAEIVARVAELPDGFTVAEFRDHFGMARRQAVPTLEWLDASGRTRRSGDGRSVRR